MALIGLKVPVEIAKLLSGVDVPGEKESAFDMHVTIMYLGRDVSVLEVAKSMCAASQVTSKITPFTCGLTSVSSFPGGDDGVPVICPVQSPGLLALNSALRTEFDRLGVGYSKKWPDYKPHVTLSYMTGENDPVEYSSPLPNPVIWTVSSLLIWGGNNSDETLSINMPFALSPLERVANRLTNFG